MATAHAQGSHFSAREIIRFSPNVPTLVTLDHEDGSPSPGAYGDQWRYTVNGGRGVMWVDPPVRDLIRASGAGIGDQIVITKAQQGKGRARWSVERVEDEPAQPVSRTPAASALALAPANAPASGNAMEKALATAFDACCSLRSYAGAKGHALNFDMGDVRAIAATLYIQANR